MRDFLVAQGTKKKREGEREEKRKKVISRNPT
jgi:hypothetical protein